MASLFAVRTLIYIAFFKVPRGMELLARRLCLRVSQYECNAGPVEEGRLREAHRELDLSMRAGLVWSTRQRGRGLGR